MKIADYSLDRMTGRTGPEPLSHADLSTVVRLAPLVSIDLIIRNSRKQVLLGLRNNQPAKGFFFIPGGIIWKCERLQDAFGRILLAETNCTANFEQARLLGVYNHFYENNRFDEPGYGTHYVVLCYELTLDNIVFLKADAQHSQLIWLDEIEVVASEQVHEYTKAYFLSVSAGGESVS